ncbi:MAG: hypothetical protein Ct9H300mP6_06560 [Gammaproteobacteria bacterium]|nr:MAG: hypothetical protein Ct9H300mP6_06560 [Gammaproteobacteria bacterium]
MQKMSGLGKSGFGGTEYLLSALVSEGLKRGPSLNKMAELTSLNPAGRYGLRQKGDLEFGARCRFCTSGP